MKTGQELTRGPMRNIRLPVAATLAAAMMVLLGAGDGHAAGGQIYDMSGLISQPHPFARPGDIKPPSLAPALAPGQAPLPGSQYRISLEPAKAPVMPAPVYAAPYAPAAPSQMAQAGLAPEPKKRGWIYLPDPPRDSRPLWGIISEARLGVLDHASSIVGPGRESGTLFAPEVLFTVPDFLSYIGSPMPTVGFQINTGPRNFMYGGLTWRLGFLDRFHMNLGFGMGIHDGDLGDEERAGTLKLGCRWQFHEVIALGTTIGERHVIEVQVDHYSHARLCSRHNSGVESIGLVYGYRF
jgi:hypothetical protein